VTWRFSSLDPATLQAPDDPSAGFLPPNNSVSDGEGSVLFTIKLKAGLAAGTQITNRASVVFDVNAPIDTPQWLNTVDSRHDLAITRITVPATVFLTTAPVTRRVTVRIQNRGVNPEIIADQSALGALVKLSVDSLGACSTPQPVLRQPTRFPVTLPSKRMLGVVFDVTFDCANDPVGSTAKNPGHGDYQVSARLNLSALGHVDSHSDDDVCPRSVPPPGVIDPNPAGTILDKGCGTHKADRTFGGSILIDVIKRP
jgi:hypothetical protein